MSQQLSSAVATEFCKYFAPFLCIMCGMLVTAFVFLGLLEGVEALYVTAPLGLASFFAFNYGVHLKKVSVDSQFLYVKGVGGVIRLPLTEIRCVLDELKPLGLVTVELKNGSAYGPKILFMPKDRGIVSPSSADRLRLAAGLGGVDLTRGV